MDTRFAVTQERLKDALILVVDDQEFNLQLITGIIGDRHRVLCARSGEEALLLAAQQRPDLILMDVVLGGMNGIDTCRRFKADEALADIPVMFITSLDSPADEGRCWRAGAVDFLNKPVNAETLMHRIRAQLTLKWQADFLRKLAFLDGLTGVYNRRYFDIQLHNYSRQQQRDRGHLSVLLVDVDHFKTYNDRHGHLLGDQCLKRVAALLEQQARRPMDVVTRYGGEEFAVLLPGTDAVGARQVAEDVVSQVRTDSATSTHNDNGTNETLAPVTVSVGIATRSGPDLTPSLELVQRADLALYQAKQQGRDRCLAYDEPEAATRGRTPVA